jgi:hypothetical protein
MTLHAHMMINQITRNAGEHSHEVFEAGRCERYIAVNTTTGGTRWLSWSTWVAGTRPCKYLNAKAICSHWFEDAWIQYTNQPAALDRAIRQTHTQANSYTRIHTHTHTHTLTSSSTWQGINQIKHKHTRTCTLAHTRMLAHTQYNTPEHQAAYDTHTNTQTHMCTHAHTHARTHTI